MPDRADISEIRWGGGESVADVHARLRAFVAALEQETGGGTILLVTHEGTLQVLQAVLAGRGHRDVVWEPIGHGEVIELSRPS